MKCQTLGQASVPGTKLASVQAFIDWLQRAWPDLYAALNAQRPDLLNTETALPSLSGIYGHSVAKTTMPSSLRDNLKNNSLLQGLSQAAVEPTSQSTSWGAELTSLAGGILTTIDQQRLFNAQVARAEAGLPPLDVSATGVPVNVGLSPGTQQLLTWALLGAGAWFLFKAVSR